MAVKRSLALLGLVLVVGGVAIVAAAILQHLGGERHYRRLLAEGERRSRPATATAQSKPSAAPWRSGRSRWSRTFDGPRRTEARRRDDEALRDLREAVRLAPDAPQPLMALGELYDLRGDAAQAAAWYAQAAEQLRDENPALLYQLALARYRTGSPAAAKDPLRRLVARNDSIAEAHYLLGLVYRDTQEIDRSDQIARAGAADRAGADRRARRAG